MTSTVQEALERQLPTSREISDLLPEGRKPYLLVRQYFELSEDRDRMEATAHVLGQLAAAQENGTLSPPMSNEMHRAVTAYSEYLLFADEQQVENHFLMTDFLLEAIFEHGYRRDG